MRIGVISDTHNYFDPQIPRYFEGVEHLLHAGDIGLPSILSQLRALAPVTAVSGNTDDPGFHFRLTETVELAGRKFLVHHIVNPHSPDDLLQARLDQEKPEVVVFGHSHVPFCERIRGTLFFNPGYAGKTRFGMQRTLAILDCTAKSIRHEFFKL